MRGLSQQFLEDLRTGLLAPFLERVIQDHSLCLEIREEYVNIYYRGGSLLRISIAPGGYQVFFDRNYAMEDGDYLARVLPPAELQSSSAVQTSSVVQAWLEVFPRLKLAMDLFLGRHPKEEREAQQLMVRDNNFGGVSRATDYYICDLEYANPHGRFDLVAVEWPSTPASRKRQGGHRLVFVEVKFGDAALTGPAGIHAHIADVNRFLAEPANLQALKDEMVTLFNQKRALGLINCAKDLVAFSETPPMLLLALANHDPDTSVLRTSLSSLPPSPHAELFLATSSLMGYGLFAQGLVPLGEAIGRLGTCV